MRGNHVGQLEELPNEVELALATEVGVGPAVGAAQGGAEGQDEEVEESVEFAAINAGVPSGSSRAWKIEQQPLSYSRRLWSSLSREARSVSPANPTL